MATSKRDVLSRDTYLDLVRLHERLTGEFQELFRGHGLTQPQYNVLRILRGGDRAGVSCQDIGQRLLTRVPDVTRLVDRMAAAGLVERSRSDEDRRVVRVRLTPRGRRLCDRLDDPVTELHGQQFAHLSRASLQTLGRSLHEALSP